MKWVASFGSALVTAVSGAFYGFFLSLGLASWLRVSSFEGAFGYFVVYGASLASVMSFVCGFVVGCLVVGPGGTGFIRSIVWSTVLACGLVTTVAGVIALVNWV